MQEDDQFQSAQKQCLVQYVNISPIHNNLPNSLKHKKIKETVHWKHTHFSKPSPFSVKNCYKNISFQAQSIEDPQCDPQCNIQEQITSSLTDYYSKYQLVYKKIKNIGTNWIGKKQYYASIFVDPSFLVKSQKQLFNIFKDEQILRNNPCEFDSDFESGNLLAVYKIAPHQYDLILQNDINTKGNTQWFYFRISNPPPNKSVKLNIVNFRKSDSLFNYGMLPCYHSVEEERKNNQGWIRKGSSIRYFKNSHQIQGSRKYYYTLTFQVSTPHPNDTIKIAQCYPYSVSDLNNYLTNLLKINYKRQVCTRQIITRTIGKNNIQILTVKQNNPKLKTNQRPLIFVIARQHPGQTPGSFICEGFMDFLLSKEKDSEYLRKNYEFKIIPMMNPDGVAVGNYRTNLMGFDLNRRWDCSTKSKITHQISFIKKYIIDISKGRQISFIIDLHGHSRKLCSFFYGNNWPTSPQDVRVFPLICSKLSSSSIKFQDSTFSYQDYKRSTARIQFLMNHKIPTIYTFEASFYGYMTKQKQKKHFTIQSYKNLGAVIGKGIYICQKGKQPLQSKQKLMFVKCMKDLNSIPSLLKFGQKQDSGSQSCPEECQLRNIQQNVLENTQEYYKQGSVKKHFKNKIMKKSLKMQMLVKDIQKSTRQMHVLDVARVNSIFPNDILALVPASFYAKSKKKQVVNVCCQTEQCTLVKVFQLCKLKQTNFSTPQFKSAIFERSKIKTTNIQNDLNNNSSNLFKLTFKSSSTTLDSRFTQSKFRTSASVKHRQMKEKRQKRQNQLFKTKQFIKHVSTQTMISFVRQIIQYQDQQNMIQSLSICQPKSEIFSTIQASRKTTYQKKQFSRTVIRGNNPSSQFQGWRIKKKSLI